MLARSLRGLSFGFEVALAICKTPVKIYQRWPPLAFMNIYSHLPVWASTYNLVAAAWTRNGPTLAGIYAAGK